MTNEEILERIENAERDKDELQHVKGKWPPRVWFRDYHGCPDFMSCVQEAYKENPRRKIAGAKYTHEYLSLAEHEAVLGERINEGYEWTRKQLNEYESLVAGKEKLIKDLEAAMAEKDERIATLKWMLEMEKKTQDLTLLSEERLESQLAVALEALEKIADPRKRDHQEPDKYTEVGCLMNIANEALTRIREYTVHSEPCTDIRQPDDGGEVADKMSASKTSNESDIAKENDERD